MARDGKTEKTLYTGCFSSATRTYYFNTYEDVSIRSYCLDEYPQTAMPSSRPRSPRRYIARLRYRTP